MFSKEIIKSIKCCFIKILMFNEFRIDSNIENLSVELKKVKVVRCYEQVTFIIFRLVLNVEYHHSLENIEISGCLSVVTNKMI